MPSIRARLGFAVTSGILLVAACVGSDPDAVPSGVDAGSSGGTSGSATSSSSGSPGVDASEDTDAADASRASACDRAKPFGLPELVTGGKWLDAQHHITSVRFATDGVYFSSDRHVNPPSNDVLDVSGLDIYAGSVTAGALNAEQLPLLSEAGVEDVAPTVTADGTTLYFSRGTSGARRLLVTHRDGGSGPFAKPSAVTAGEGVLVSNAAVETDPYVAGTMLYFSARIGSADQKSHLYALDTSAAGASPAIVLGFEDATADDLRFPVVRSDGLELFYAKSGSLGEQVVYSAKRDRAEAKFVRDPVPLYPVDGAVPSVFTPTWISADGCELYLGGRGSASKFQVYRAVRPK